MLVKLFPATIDDNFPGNRIALYVFYALTALTLWRSQHHLLAHDGGAQSIATIPLDTYSANASDTIIGIFSLWGLSQLIIGLIYLIAALRYRAMILVLPVKCRASRIANSLAAEPPVVKKVDVIFAGVTSTISAASSLRTSDPIDGPI